MKEAQNTPYDSVFGIFHLVRQGVVGVGKNLPPDLSGQRFGKLRVVERSMRGGGDVFVCLCECGTRKEIGRTRLLRGSAKSCGHEDCTGQHGMCGTPTYQSWAGMHRRCTNPNLPSWKYYGAQGVSVTPRWNKFENFLADMGIRPKGLTIDRWPDKNGNYEPGNCRWATASEQAYNRRPRKFRGKTKMRQKVVTIKEMARERGISLERMYRILQERDLEMDAPTFVSRDASH